MERFLLDDPMFFRRLTANLNDLKDYLTGQLNPTMTDTLYDSVFGRLPTIDNKLPLKNKNTLNENRQVLESKSPHHDSLYPPVHTRSIVPRNDLQSVRKGFRNE